MSVASTPAVLLRAYPYSETSQILRFYTETFGVLGVLARGVRKSGARRGGSLSTFAEGILTLHHRDRRDLQTFQDFAPSKPRRGLATHPLRLAGASVLAELILQHAEGEGSPVLFRRLGAGLDRLESEDLGTLLGRILHELWGLIGVLGFSPSLDRCIECGAHLNEEGLFHFDLPAGGLCCEICQQGAQGPRLGPTARRQLATMVRGDELHEGLLRPTAHLRLASDFITYHISGGSPLRSVEVLVNLIPKTHAR